MQRYQFSSPSVPEKDDFSNHVDASTSLINDNSIAGKSNVTNGQGNGHSGGILNGALSSDRARLFKKANSCGRPVREWYVWTEECLVKRLLPYFNSVQNRKKIIKSKHCMVKNCVIFLCHQLFLKKWLCSVTSSKYQCRLLLVLANLINVIIIIKSILLLLCLLINTYHNHCNVDQSFLVLKDPARLIYIS